MKFAGSEDDEANENGNELYGYSDDSILGVQRQVMCLKS